jgi:hypothetical protein
VEEAGELGRRIDALEGRVKRGETNVLRAMTTLLADLQRYRAGQSGSFPNDSLLGLVYALLVRRILVVAFGLLGALVAGAQVFLLLQQNQLIDQQNRYINAQTEANNAEALSSLLSRLDPNDETGTRILVAQMSIDSQRGLPVLLELARGSDTIASIARDVLVRTYDAHSSEQSDSAVTALVDGFIAEFDSACGTEAHSYWYPPWGTSAPRWRSDSCLLDGELSDRATLAAVQLNDYFHRMIDSHRYLDIDEGRMQTWATEVVLRVLTDLQGGDPRELITVHDDGTTHPSFSVGSLSETIGILCAGVKLDRQNRRILDLNVRHPSPFFVLTSAFDKFDFGQATFVERNLGLRNFVISYGIPELCSRNTESRIADFAPEHAASPDPSP